MNNKYFISAGVAFFGVLACLDGLARLLSGTHSLYNGAKHPWLSGFFMMFGPAAPYAAAVFSFSIGLLFFYFALQIFRASDTSDQPASVSPKNK